MAIETVEAFAERTSAAVNAVDRAGYLALFELPCAVWGDVGCSLRLTQAHLDEIWRGGSARQ